LIVKRANLTEKTLDETEVERDFKVRKRIKLVFNKGENDFRTLLEFNNYEEDVEDMIYNLTNGIDEVAINKRLDSYRVGNAKQIAVNQSKLAEIERGICNTIKDAETQKLAQKTNFEVPHFVFCLC
jgi:CDK-activating kinase assembly factor MAT1